MVDCYIGLGSNLGQRGENIKRALIYLAALPRTRVEKVSRIYETIPVQCPQGSPAFLNVAAKIKTGLSAQVLLKEFKNIEASLGRIPGPKNSPRSIDLDILFFGNQKINSDKLVIPHLNLEERDFVLRPLKEIAPEIIKRLSKKMKICKNIGELRGLLFKEKIRSKKIGFVPTMGCLHQGHLSLVRQAKKENDICVVSIFVNPAQFGKNEDFKKYPRGLEVDSILARSAGCDYLFVPEAGSIYPVNYSTYITMPDFESKFCGKTRPGHFKGVLTVVAKLFNIIGPDTAYFGEKDYQQAFMVSKMVEDLNLPLKIKVMPIVREPDGLAMSSRNVYLNRRERIDARVLCQSLQKAKKMILSGQNRSDKIIIEIKKEILRKESARIDYVEIVDAQTLEPKKYIEGKVAILLAVWIGKTRLIDNMVITV